MAEKNLLAFFKSPEEAERAKEKLHGIGVKTIQIDNIDRYPAEERPNVIQTLSGQYGSLAAITKEQVPSGNNEGILMATNIDSSGMSGDTDAITGRNILLTAVMEEGLHHEAIRIVKEMGAIL